MIRVDEEFMLEVGLSDMSPKEKAGFMQDAEEELEVRIGRRIGSEMTDEQLLEFESLTDMVMAAEWLEQNVPDYREITQKVFDDFKAEIKAEAEGRG